MLHSCVQNSMHCFIFEYTVGNEKFTHSKNSQWQWCATLVYYDVSRSNDTQSNIDDTEHWKRKRKQNIEEKETQKNF